MLPMGPPPHSDPTTDGLALRAGIIDQSAQEKGRRLCALSLRKARPHGEQGPTRQVHAAAEACGVGESCEVRFIRLGQYVVDPASVSLIEHAGVLAARRHRCPSLRGRREPVDLNFCLGTALRSRSPHGRKSSRRLLETRARRARCRKMLFGARDGRRRRHVR